MAKWVIDFFDGVASWGRGVANAIAPERAGLDAMVESYKAQEFAAGEREDETVLRAVRDFVAQEEARP